jgi:hypothetical protein
MSGYLGDPSWDEADKREKSDRERQLEAQVRELQHRAEQAEADLALERAAENVQVRELEAAARKLLDNPALDSRHPDVAALTALVPVKGDEPKDN